MAALGRLRRGRHRCGVWRDGFAAHVKSRRCRRICFLPSW
jgi:hypothetical protein